MKVRGTVKVKARGTVKVKARGTVKVKALWKEICAII